MPHATTSRSPPQEVVAFLLFLILSGAHARKQASDPNEHEFLLDGDTGSHRPLVHLAC